VCFLIGFSLWILNLAPIGARHPKQLLFLVVFTWCQACPAPRTACHPVSSPQAKHLLTARTLSCSHIAGPGPYRCNGFGLKWPAAISWARILCGRCSLDDWRCWHSHMFGSWAAPIAAGCPGMDPNASRWENSNDVIWGHFSILLPG